MPRKKVTTAAPIAWPWSYLDNGGGQRQLILTGDLVRAIRTESNQGAPEGHSELPS